jgi:hypothetical protein
METQSGNLGLLIALFLPDLVSTLAFAVAYVGATVVRALCGRFSVGRL